MACLCGTEYVSSKYLHSLRQVETLVCIHCLSLCKNIHITLQHVNLIMAAYFSLCAPSICKKNHDHMSTAAIQVLSILT